MVHHVFACKSNLGDWLSARGIQSLLRPLTLVEHFCDEPFVGETLQRLSECGPRDLVILGGGGLFMDYFTPFWEGFAPLAERVPFCIWGVGYCDLKSRPSRAPVALLEGILRRSRLTTVRDDLTREHLRACALPPPVPCPSMAVVTPPAARGWGVLHCAHWGDVGEEAYQAMAGASRSLAERTGRPYAETDNQIPDGDEEALWAQLSRYARADLVLSSRLHGCILGLASGCRVMAVAADRKVESFMRAAGLGEWVVGHQEAGSLAQDRRLDLLPEQPVPSRFLERARRENRRVAEGVRGLVAELGAA